MHWNKLRGECLRMGVVDKEGGSGRQGGGTSSTKEERGNTVEAVEGMGVREREREARGLMVRVRVRVGQVRVRTDQGYGQG